MVDIAGAKKGRPRKNPTKEQLQTISQFRDYMVSSGAISASTRITNGMSNLHNLSETLAGLGMYNPIWSEQLEQEIGFHAESSTTEELTEWLQHPEQYSINLRRLSSYLENTVAQYGRAINLLSDIKLYNYDLRCATTDLQEKVEDGAFKKSYNKALNTLRRLNIPYQIRKLDSRVAKEGVAFVWFNKHPDGIDLLTLPTDYCYITSSWTYGYLFAIDLTYFDRFAFNREQVPELWEAYKAFCIKREQAVSGEKLAPFQYYPVSPFEGWCCVFDSVRPLKIPPLISGAQGAMDSLSYRELIKQKAIIDLWRVLAFKIPIDDKTGKMQISYNEASDIINVIKDSLPENFVSFASPFTTESPINADQTPVMEALQNISNKSFYDYAAIPNALFNSDLKSAAALKLSANTTFAYASSGMYASMQNLVNWILRIECGSTFDWHVVFHGNKLFEDEEKEKAVKLFTTANAPASYVWSHFGYEPFDVENAFVIENKLGIKDKMKPLTLMNAAPSSPGAPEKPASNKSESSDMVEDAGL